MRNFSKKQRTAAELVADRTGEADHITPYAKGGDTSIENCQIVTPGVNKRKAAFCFVPRNWQSLFLADWDRRRSGRPFMLMAIPGSGKTMAALEAARLWMAAGPDRRVVVVVPSDNLRNQWQTEARKFGIELQTKEFGTNFKHGFSGGVVTYHLVGNQPLVFRKLCSVAPTMVIFDEIHHCGDESHFGVGIREAFSLAKEILCMSGTPWKTDGQPIPFVRYDGDGFAVADCRYDYPDALIDGVVRNLVFDYSKGLITNDASGQQLELSTNISDEDAAKRLGILLDAEGEYVEQQIREAHRKLMSCRRDVRDAGAMAICIDQWHATKVARAISRVTGSEPSIIVSDDQIENDTVDAFRKSSKEWLVSVRKVSEGTDIKRLQVLCYLTNVTSELFFRQVIGRVSRVRGMEDYEAYVYLPADPRLIRCARNIENAQVVALREQREREQREDREWDIESDDEGTTWTTEHNGTDAVMIGAVQVSIADARKIQRYAEAAGTSMQKALVLYEMMMADIGSPIVADVAVVDGGLESRCDKLRAKCNKAAYRLSKSIGVDVKEVHKRFKPQAMMSEAELIAKHKTLLAEERNAERH